jgi:hypothetical protein
MRRFYGGTRRPALAAALDEVEGQRNNRDDDQNDGGDGEPDAREREQRRPRCPGALGLSGEVVRRPFGSRARIARGLLVPRPTGHDVTLNEPASA